MDDLVEARSLVHQGHGLVVQRLEQLRRLVQGQGHAVAPHDGDAVSWEEHLGSQRGHLPEGGRPIARVALHLLRVAGVGRGPDEEVATAQHLALGCPGPRVVVGLASRMVQLERGAADVEAEPVAIGLVRVAVLGGPLQVREPELALVDERVVPGGERSNRAGMASWATTRVRGQPRPAASSSKTGTPKTWSMWPCEYTAVCSGAPDQRRSS